MTQVHAIVWLDHRDARVASFSMNRDEAVEIHAEGPDRHIHYRAGSIGSGHTPDDHAFFDEIADALVDVREIVIAGPGTAKTAFETYLQDRYPDIARHVVGVEPLDHPTEGELLAHARTYFKGVDQLGIA